MGNANHTAAMRVIKAALADGSVPRVALTKTIVAQIPTPEDTERNRRAGFTVHDEEVPGLDVKVYPSGKRTWALYYRTAIGTQRRQVIGDARAMPPDAARERARQLLGDVAHGRDPAAEKRDARRAEHEALTMQGLADWYLEEHARPHKKPSSVAFDERNLSKHVLPRLGARKVGSITFEDVAALHQAMRATPIAANRTVTLLGTMLKLAERWGLRPLNSNPCHHVTRYREQRLHRDLTDLEMRRLAQALDRWPHEPHQPAVDKSGRRIKHSRTDRALPLTAEETGIRIQACDAIRLLLFTGCRRGEVLGLKWSEVDLQRGLLRFEDSKTGAKVVALNSAAREIIERQPRLKLDDSPGTRAVPVDNPYVFPSRRKGRGHGKPMRDLNNAWANVRRLAEFEGRVRLHDLRHNFASFGVSGGVGLAVVGRLLGHKHASTTQRYADVGDDPARRASEAIGQALTRAMGEATTEADTDAGEVAR